ncbi:MAG TPA: hypothetical protein VHG32_08965 [Thermoanaerobaculia bacterium]|jgi:hypothetical protein|nr:hypothetical protein [Thermoanaerobaculia bacterium]
MLEAVPTAATLGKVYRGEGGNAANATGYTVGSTRDPVRFQLPAVSLEVQESADDNTLAPAAPPGLSLRQPVALETCLDVA